ncbi:hypothetical protein F3Y22_tig00110321pilonHSYRG00220 [Hibiscus syriacus]|uniref:Uncharacterized protein n=1 Tax=Hibiscus syriacus TaxID=106335 RepID=A0A6A3B2L0_HIBSY|nr:hypothetical protein F3Y22_tig00110321pilonHSYRG00220 [Hibiscus syriacus]
MPCLQKPTLQLDFARLLPSIRMAAPTNTVSFPDDEDNRFFLCGFCGNHILNAIGNNFFFRIQWTAPDGVDVDGILCNANTPVNLRFDTIANVLTNYARPMVYAYCNEDDCSEILGVKFISSGRVLDNLPVEIYIGEGQEAVFLAFGVEKDDLLYWNGVRRFALTSNSLTMTTESPDKRNLERDSSQSHKGNYCCAVVLLLMSTLLSKLGIAKTTESTRNLCKSTLYWFLALATTFTAYRRYQSFAMSWSWSSSSSYPPKTDKESLRRQRNYINQKVEVVTGTTTDEYLKQLDKALGE